jgi:hypothetical protein
MLACLREPQAVRIGRTNGPEFCSERKCLIEAFLEAVHEIIALQNEQTQSVIDGDPEFSRFDLMLHFAQEKKDQAKYAWIAHVENHGCGKE